MFPIVDEAQDIEDAADDASSCGFDLDAYGLESPAYSSDISDDEVDEQVEVSFIISALFCGNAKMFVFFRRNLL